MISVKISVASARRWATGFGLEKTDSVSSQETASRRVAVRIKPLAEYHGTARAEALAQKESRSFTGWRGLLHRPQHARSRCPLHRLPVRPSAQPSNRLRPLRQRAR